MMPGKPTVLLTFRKRLHIIYVHDNVRVLRQRGVYNA